LAARPPVELELQWEGGSRLRGAVGAVPVVLDWDGRTAPSPVQALAFALAGCMASDVVLTLQKGRLPLTGLRVRFTGERAPEEPRRFVAVTLSFEITGAVPPDRVERAIALSRETYCSVWHSMRPDIVLTTRFNVQAE
jgi:putative redox protein